MRPLARLDAEAFQSAFDDHARLGDLLPLDRNAQKGIARPPPPRPDEDVTATGFAHPRVERVELARDRLRRERVETFGLHVDDVADVVHVAHAQRVSGIDERIVGRHAAPVERAVVVVVDDRADLQQIEDPLLPVRDVHVDGELHLDRTAHLLDAQTQDVAHDVRQRKGVVFENGVEGNHLAPLVHRRIGDAVVLAVPHRSHEACLAHRSHLAQRQPPDVDRIVGRRAERFGAQVERQHLVLRIAQRQFGRGGLQHLLRVAGRETQRAAAVDDQLAQSEGDVADPLFGRLVAYGVVVD